VSALHDAHCGFIIDGEADVAVTSIELGVDIPDKSPHSLAVMVAGTGQRHADKSCLL